MQEKEKAQIQEQLNVVESVLNVAQKAGLINDLQSAAKVFNCWTDIVLQFMNMQDERERLIRIIEEGEKERADLKIEIQTLSKG